MSDEIPCKCGHTHFESKQRLNGRQKYRTTICFAGVKDKNGREPYCICGNYSPDNLMYVEQLAKKKGLV